MAKLDGASGNFIGRIGNMVYYLLNGKIVGRTIGKVESYSDKQLEIQMRTAVISPFFKTLNDFIRIGFKNTPKEDPNWNFYNIAMSLNNPQAIKGTYPDLEINYEKIILSEGAIPSPKNPHVLLNGNILEFTWDPDVDAKGADNRDQVMLLAWFPETEKTVFLTSGARRTDGKERLKLPSFKDDTIIETYISFTADDRTDVSTSVYTGQLIWKKAHA